MLVPTCSLAVTLQLGYWACFICLHFSLALTLPFSGSPVQPLNSSWGQGWKTSVSLCLKSHSYWSSTTICSKNRGEQWECFTQIVSQRGKNRAVFKHCEPISSRPSFYVIDFFVTVQLEPPCMSLLLEPFPCTGNDIHAERARAIFNEETGFVLGAQYEF